MMKKSVSKDRAALIAALCLMLSLSLMGCSQPAQTSNQTYEPPVSSGVQSEEVQAKSKTEEAWMAANARESEFKDIVVAYFPNYDMLGLTIKESRTSEDIISLMEIIQPLLKGQDVRLKMSTHSGTANVLTSEFLPYFAEYTSLHLTIPLNPEAADALEGMSNLTSLDIGRSAVEELPVLERLESLTIKMVADQSYALEGIDRQPALKVLTIIKEGYSTTQVSGLASLSRCPSLSELQIIEDKKNKPFELSSLGADHYFICQAALACPTLTVINGINVGTFDLEAISNERNRADYYKDIAEKESRDTLNWNAEFQRRYDAGEIAIMQGQPVLDGPFILRGVDNDGSIPAEYLTKSLDSCKYMVFVTREFSDAVKHYTNGGEGYQTITYFIVYDLAADTVSEKIIVAVTDPPDSFTGSVGSDARGPEQREAALPMIKSMLG